MITVCVTWTSNLAICCIMNVQCSLNYLYLTATCRLNACIAMFNLLSVTIWPCQYITQSWVSGRTCLASLINVDVACLGVLVKLGGFIESFVTLSVHCFVSESLRSVCDVISVRSTFPIFEHFAPDTNTVWHEFISLCFYKYTDVSSFLGSFLLKLHTRTRAHKKPSWKVQRSEMRASMSSKTHIGDVETFHTSEILLTT